MSKYPCNVTEVPNISYYKNYISFIFQKNSPYTKLFSFKMLAMMQVQILCCETKLSHVCWQHNISGRAN